MPNDEKRLERIEKQVDWLVENTVRQEQLEGLRSTVQSVVRQLPGETQLQTEDSCRSHRRALWYALAGIGTLAIAALGLRIFL